MKALVFNSALAPHRVDPFDFLLEKVDDTAVLRQDAAAFFATALARHDARRNAEATLAVYRAIASDKEVPGC